MSAHDFIAQTDQQREELKTFAPVLGTYFKALVTEGFERDEALDLVRDYQSELFENTRHDDE